MYSKPISTETSKEAQLLMRARNAVDDRGSPQDIIYPDEMALLSHYNSRYQYYGPSAQVSRDSACRLLAAAILDTTGHKPTVNELITEPVISL